MAKYRKKALIEATQWLEHGDNKNVRKYSDSKDSCNYCNMWFKHHGWINTLEGDHIVCPGDWIATGIKDEYWPIKPDIFKQTYEKVEG